MMIRIMAISRITSGKTLIGFTDVPRRKPGPRTLRRSVSGFYQRK
jgi:hypothetical protein